MRTGSKIAIGIGVLILLVGLIIGGLGVRSLSTLEEPFTLENVNNGTVTLNDEDGLGEFGLTFWVDSEYVDADDDGFWDHCNSTSIEIISHPEVHQNYIDRNEDVEDEDKEGGGVTGGFYYEAGNWDEYPHSNCKADEKNQNWDMKDHGLIKIGRACLGCTSGTLEFESNGTVWVTYDDPLIANLIGGLIGLGGSTCSICCGLIVLIIGLATGFNQMEDDELKSNIPVSYTADGQMIYAVHDTPGVEQVVTQDVTTTEPNLSEESSSSEPPPEKDVPNTVPEDSKPESEHSEWFN